MAFGGLLLVLNPKATVDVNGVPSSDPWTKAILLIAGLVVCVLGVLLVVARRYQPDSKKTSDKKGD